MGIGMGISLAVCFVCEREAETKRENGGNLVRQNFEGQKLCVFLRSSNNNNNPLSNDNNKIK